MTMKALLKIAAIVAVLALVPPSAQAQVDESQTGLWSMYFWNTTFGDGPWGAQGDVQYRQFDIGQDLEQILIRGGVTWRPREMQNVLVTFGYANITSGTFGPSDAETDEDRIYQEALLSHKPASWLNIRHRFRTEQRWVDDQDFRTRFRYAAFADIPLNGVAPGPGSLYLAFYNEIFINGEREINDGVEVDLFDRSRTYAALGYGLTNGLRLQFGYMHQETANLGKGQVQMSVHHNF